MPLPDHGSWGRGEYDLLADTTFDKSGQRCAFVGRMANYRFPPAVFEVRAVGAQGPWFIDVLDPEGKSKSIISALRMAKKSGFIPVIARRRLVNEPEVRLWRSSRLSVAKTGGDDLRDKGHQVRLALAELARADEGRHEKALLRVTEKLAKMGSGSTGTVTLEIGLLQFSLSDEIDRIVTHPAILLPPTYADAESPTESGQ